MHTSGSLVALATAVIGPLSLSVSEKRFDLVDCTWDESVPGAPHARIVQAACMHRLEPLSTRNSTCKV